MRYARGADRNIEISKLISIQLLSMNLTRLQISFSNNSNGLLVPDKWIRDQPFVKGQYSSFQDLCTIVPPSVFFFFFFVRSHSALISCLWYLFFPPSNLPVSLKSLSNRSLVHDVDTTAIYLYKMCLE